jgi:uncharacterized membrane protein YedE/YeeE
MSGGKIALIVLGVVLFIIGYAGLFPVQAMLLVAGARHYYTVGLNLDPPAWHLFGAIGGAAAVGGIWALSSAFRQTH